jgi:hypothetical protein
MPGILPRRKLRSKWMEIFERDELQFSLNIILAKAIRNMVSPNLTQCEGTSLLPRVDNLRLDWVSLPVPSKYVHSGRKQTRESSREEELTRANGGLKIRCTGFAQVWYVRLLFIPGLRSEHHQICKTDFRVLSPSHYFNARRSKKTKLREIIRELLSDAGGEFSNS